MENSLLACEFCNGTKLYEHTDDYVEIDQGQLDILIHHHNGDFTEVNLPANYCLMCGRSLTTTPTPEALSLEQLMALIPDDKTSLKDLYGKTWLAYATKPAKEGKG